MRLIAVRVFSDRLSRSRNSQRSMTDQPLTHPLTQQWLPAMYFSATARHLFTCICISSVLAKFISASLIY